MQANKLVSLTPPSDRCLRNALALLSLWAQRQLSTSVLNRLSKDLFGLSDKSYIEYSAFISNMALGYGCLERAAIQGTRLQNGSSETGWLVVSTSSSRPISSK